MVGEYAHGYGDDSAGLLGYSCREHCPRNGSAVARSSMDGNLATVGASLPLFTEHGRYGPYDMRRYGTAIRAGRHWLGTSARLPKVTQESLRRKPGGENRVR